MNKLFFIPLSILALLFTSCITDDEGNDVNPTPCQVAEISSESARIDFENAAPEDYTETCNNYKTALQQQITTCGDADGSIQTRIDTLGDCTDPDANVVTGQITVTAGTLDIVFDEITIVQQGTLLRVTGTTSAANDYTIFFEVEEDAVGSAAMENFQLDVISTYVPIIPSFTSSIDVNTDTALSGTFSGSVENNDGGQLELTNGVIDLSY
tara:strand:+ start:3377 stop:4009 length:633 start_codon:yes stop_codon:yes gene_type:complete